ncbi:MAG: DUF885 domain-containing protein [Pseudomonadota bacterium]
MTLSLCCLTLTACVEGGSPDASSERSPGDTSVAESATDPFTLFLEGYWEDYIELNPWLATLSGDSRYNDRFTWLDVFPSHRIQVRLLHERYLSELSEFDREGLTEQQKLSYDVFARHQELALEGLEFPEWFMPLDNQVRDPYGLYARWGSGAGLQPFRTTEDYRNWYKRLAGIDEFTDAAISNMREGLRQGYSRPRHVMENVLSIVDSVLEEDVEQSLYWGSIRSMPAQISENQRVALTEEYRTLLADRVMPAYRTMSDFLREEYIPACRESAGLLDLPNGRAWYAHLVKLLTSTSLSPPEIHEIGQDEMARIRLEMDAVRAELGFDGSLTEFYEHLRQDDRYYYSTEDEVLAEFAEIRGRVKQALPPLFDLAPTATYVIRPVAENLGNSDVPAFYTRPSLDGSRPGVFWVNTNNLRAIPRYITEALFLHEAEPGHHFQISIAQAVDGLPAFRTYGFETAYAEGWALYVEDMGRELGMYADPLQYYGKLAAENRNAMRLVVDTGLHYFGWTREQAVDYMVRNSSFDRQYMENEVERYMADPAQSLAYKVGQLAISDLRRKAATALGDRFDVKTFHRQILIDGPLPIEVLERKIDDWLARVRGP